MADQQNLQPAPLTDEQLKAKIGADVYDALMAKIAAKPSGSGELVAFLKDALKKWTLWAGGVVAAWPLIQPQAQPMLDQMLGAHASAKLISAIGFVVVLKHFIPQKNS